MKPDNRYRPVSRTSKQGCKQHILLSRYAGTSPDSSIRLIQQNLLTDVR